jgi:hypothetical protein
MKNEINARVCVCVLYQAGNTPMRISIKRNQHKNAFEKDRVDRILEAAGGVEFPRVR